MLWVESLDFFFLGGGGWECVNMADLFSLRDVGLFIFLIFFSLFFVVFALSDVYIPIQESIEVHVHTTQEGSYGRWVAGSC